MKSNMEKYTHASFVETTRERKGDSVSPVSGRSVVMVPGVFPVCAVCEKDCRTLADDKYQIQVGSKMTPDTPMLCRACKSVVCQECVVMADVDKSVPPCRKCGSSKGIDWLLPFVFCDSCGKRSALISGATQGEATYMLLDKGATPLRCTQCQSINCADCLSKNNACKKCGASPLELFVPGCMDTGVIIANIDPSGGHITLAVPGSAAANSAQLAAQKKEEIQAEKVKKLVEDLNAPGFKFWIDKKKALRELKALGAAAKPALPVVRTFLCRAGYRIPSIEVFGAAGNAATGELSALLGMVDNGPFDEAAAAAMAIEAMKQCAVDAIPTLKRVLARERKRGDTGLRLASGLALFTLKELSSDEVTKLCIEHLEKNPSGFPEETYLESILTIG